VTFDAQLVSIPIVDRERWLFERWAEVDAWVTSASI
jgi:hypothetical protein